MRLQIKMNSSNKLSDSEMVKLIRSQSKAGAESLYDQYAAVLNLVILRIVCQKHDADIIMEKTFVQIWTTIDLFNEQEKTILGWMLTIAKTAASGEQSPKL